MSEAKLNEHAALNPLARSTMEALGCLCALGDADALPMRRFAMPVRMGFGPEHDAARRILLEARHHGLAALALRSGCETIVDFPCGCLPRPFANAGLCFIGLGAPAIMEAAKAVWEGPRARFFPADATNPASILQSLESARGSVCILTAGLFPTMTAPELDPLCDALGHALRAHGGCWLTMDPESPRAFMDTLKALCGNRYMDVLLKSNDMRQWKTEGQFDNPLVIDPRWDFERLRDKAIALLGRYGLRVERIPMALRTSELLSMPAEPTARGAVRQALDAQRCWKITAAASARARKRISRLAGLDIVSERDGDLLRMWLSGRLDTLASPAFFDRFTAESEGLRAVEIDCSALEYMSSAGLRVLLQILKCCPVTLYAINEEVGDVLEKTGFDTIVEIKSGVMGDA